MAIGAQHSDVLGLVLGEGARMAALGVAIGIGASLAISRIMSTLLFGISATDPLTFAPSRYCFALSRLQRPIFPRTVRCVSIPSQPCATSSSVSG
jgi:putative ABC transport system permease protein